MLKSCKIYTCTNGTLGLHLSRAPWDPYPWVSSIQKDSTSYQAGLRTGDCLLELNGQDVLGMKISEIAALLKNHWLNESSNYVTAVIWRNKCNSSGKSGNATTNDCTKSFNVRNYEDDDGDEDEDDDDDGNDDDDEDEENNAHNINQQSLQKFATCLQHIAQLLECPVCLEVIKPPGWQCCNGHVLCNNCRSRSEKCPVCRVPLGPRGRCLLSDKLFTLLADSFPCDGVRSNKNSPKNRRKCSTEFHNQPKMTVVQKQHQHHQQQQQEKHEQHQVKKAKDFLLTSLRHRRRKLSNPKTSHDDSKEQDQPGVTKEENKHPSMHKQAIMYDTDAVVVVRNSFKSNTAGNRKSSPDYNKEAAAIVEQSTGEANGIIKSVATTFRCNELQEQISTIQQCHCLTCFKSDEVGIASNATTARVATATTASAALNKYILRIPSQGQLGENIVQQQQQQHEEKYQNYHCPTGKLCCLNVNVNVTPHATCLSTGMDTFTVANNNKANTTATNNSSDTNLRERMTNNKLSTRTTAVKTTAAAADKETNAKLTQTALMTAHQHHHQLPIHQVNGFNNFYKILKNEWDILAHLTEDHKLPVNQYYAEYGQRISVPCLIQQHSITYLNLRGSAENDEKVEKFFIACIPLEMTSTSAATNLKVAIFLYHMNTVGNDAITITNTTTSLNDEVSCFETIIENPLMGIKWFGRAHPLTISWSHIHEKQHFLHYDVLQNHLVSGSGEEAAVNNAIADDNAFVIVIKRKLEIKSND